MPRTTKKWMLVDMEANHIAGLCIRSSSIAGYGLFTLNAIPRNQAIGIWTGDQMPSDKWVHDDYGCELTYDGACTILTPMRSGEIDYMRDPFAAMNEPPKHACANVYARVEDQKWANVAKTENTSDVMLMMVFYAAEDIKGQTELLWHYGLQYDRKYEVGAPPKPIDAFDSPIVRFQRMLDHRPDGLVRVPAEDSSSYTSESSDPDYVP